MFYPEIPHIYGSPNATRTSLDLTGLNHHKDLPRPERFRPVTSYLVSWSISSIYCTIVPLNCSSFMQSILRWTRIISVLRLYRAKNSSLVKSNAKSSSVFEDGTSCLRDRENSLYYFSSLNFMLMRQRTRNHIRMRVAMLRARNRPRNRGLLCITRN